MSSRWWSDAVAVVEEVVDAVAEAAFKPADRFASGFAVDALL
jgi:hypothetical protein